jgi:hypothetical protein
MPARAARPRAASPPSLGAAGLALLSLAALAAACGAEADDGVLTAAARLPEQHPDLVFTLVSPDRLTFDYRAPPPADRFAPGQILVGEQYGGYLRRVTAVAVDGNRLVAQTRQATLTEAVANLSFEATLSAEPGRARVPLLDLAGRVLLDTDVGGVPTRLTLVGAALQIEPDLDVSFAIAERRLQQLTVAVRVAVTLDVELRLELGAATAAAPIAHEVDVSGPSFLLYNRPFSFPVATPLGPLPIAGTLELDAIAGFAATASAPGAVTLGAVGQSAFLATATWNGATWTVDAAAPSFAATAHVPSRDALTSPQLGAYVRPVVHARFFGLAGPRATLIPSLRAALPAAAPLALEACAAAELAVPFDLFGPQLVELAHPAPGPCAPLALP